MPKYTIEEWNKIVDELCEDNDLIRLEEYFKLGDCIDSYKKFKAMTKEGYIVYPSIQSLRLHRQPLRFSINNQDTIHNIKLWIKNNHKKVELLSKEYEGENIDLRWLCKNNTCKMYNKEFLKCWHTVKSGHGCSDCGVSKMREIKQNKLPPKGESLFDVYRKICDDCWDYERNSKTPDQYYPKSNQSAYWKCNECGYLLENKLIIQNVVKHGISCPKCSDGISYPQKFMFSVFEQLLGKNFQTQLSKTTFKWCGAYRYDFYTGQIDCIIETHGNFHYEDSSWSKKEDVQENDKNKERLARENGIRNYIIINCRKSELKWIKDSIMQSELPTLLNFKESDIDWLKCHEVGCSSLVKVVCDLWNDGMENINDLNKITGLGNWAIRNYLKKGNEIDWCNYDPGKEMKINGHQIGKQNGKPIIQLDKKGRYINEYESMSEVARVLNLYVANISKVCNGLRISTGGFVFKFKENYIK